MSLLNYLGGLRGRMPSTVARPSPARLVSGPAPFDVSAGQALSVAASGELTGEVVGVGEVTDGAATAEEVAAWLGTLANVAVRAVGDRVVFETTSLGALASLQLGGAVAEALRVALGVARGSDGDWSMFLGARYAGERAPAAFTDYVQVVGPVPEATRHLRVVGVMTWPSEGSWWATASTGPGSTLAYVQQLTPVPRRPQQFEMLVGSPGTEVTIRLQNTDGLIANPDSVELPVLEVIAIEPEIERFAFSTSPVQGQRGVRPAAGWLVRVLDADGEDFDRLQIVIEGEVVYDGIDEDGAQPGYSADGSLDAGFIEIYVAPLGEGTPRASGQALLLQVRAFSADSSVAAYEALYFSEDTIAPTVLAVELVSPSQVLVLYDEQLGPGEAYELLGPAARSVVSIEQQGTARLLELDAPADLVVPGTLWIWARDEEGNEVISPAPVSPLGVRGRPIPLPHALRGGDMESDVEGLVGAERALQLWLCGSVDALLDPARSPYPERLLLGSPIQADLAYDERDVRRLAAWRHLAWAFAGSQESAEQLLGWVFGGVVTLARLLPGPAWILGETPLDAMLGTGPEDPLTWALRATVDRTPTTAEAERLVTASRRVLPAREWIAEVVGPDALALTPYWILGLDELGYTTVLAP